MEAPDAIQTQIAAGRTVDASVNGLRGQLEALTARHGGEYDGWEAGPKP